MSKPTISDPRVLAIPIQDNGEDIVDIREFPQFVLHPDNNELSDQSTMIRRGVAERLLQVAAALQGSRLMILECYRPLALQAQYFNDYVAELTRTYPDYSSSMLKDLASRYVAPPTITPPHCTGGALDLTLCDMDGKELDVGASVNATPLATEGAVYTEAKGLSRGGDA